MSKICTNTQLLTSVAISWAKANATPMIQLNIHTYLHTYTDTHTHTHTEILHSLPANVMASPKLEAFLQYECVKYQGIITVTFIVITDFSKYQGTTCKVGIEASKLLS